MEFKVLWDSIRSGTEKISVKKDSVFGLAINFHDNDIATRQASVMWGAVMLDAAWNTPKYLGTVKFLDGNKLAFIAKNNMTGRVNPVPYDGTPFFVNVDGTRDPIYSAARTPADGYLQIRSFAHNDNGTPVNDADLSAKIWAAWDPTWLYMFAEVTDDTVSATAVNTYQNDGLELKIDPQPKDSVTNSIFAPNFTALDGANSAAGGSDSLSAFKGAQKYFRKKVTGGYVLEFAVPWDSITANSEKISVAKDSVFGLGINIHDNDVATRQASVVWGAVMLDASWNTPKYLGTVKFLADNKLSFIAKNNMTGVTNPIPYDGSDYNPGSVEQIDGLPLAYSLGQNYPNPFNPTTTIQFSIPVANKVRIELFNTIGQMVGEVAKGDYEAGSYKVVFNASQLASGVYFYRLVAGDFVNVKKLVLLK